MNTMTDTEYQLENGVLGLTELSYMLVNMTIPSSNQIRLWTLTTTSSDTAYLFTDISLTNLVVSSNYEIDVNLTCSLSGNSIISNSFSSDEGYEIPTWISWDEANSKLIVNTPALSQPTNFTFTLEAVTSEKPYPVYRKVYIQVSWWVTDCKFWESNSNSRCSQWANGYQVYSNSKTCESSSVDSTADTSSKLTISAISAAMVLSLLISVLSLSSPSGIWTVISIYQVLMLLLLTGAYFPKLITDFMSGLSFTMFSFNFVPVLNLSIMKKVSNWLDYNLDDDYLKTIGMKSGSTFINNLNTFLILWFVIILNIIFWILYKFMVKAFKPFPKLIKFVQWVSKLLTLSIYIRMMLESNQFWLITSIYEIKLIQTNNSGRLTSFIIAWWLLIVWIKFTIAVIWRTISSMRQESHLLQTTFEELFKEKKNNKTAKFHSVSQIIRRTLIILLLMMLDFLNIYIKLAVFLIFNVPYFIYIVLARPMVSIKENFIEIQNEVLLFILTWILFFWNQKSDWSKTIEYAFIELITASSIIVFIIFLGKFMSLYVGNFIIDLFKRWRYKKSTIKKSQILL